MSAKEGRWAKGVSYTGLGLEFKPAKRCVETGRSNRKSSGRNVGGRKGALLGNQNGIKGREEPYLCRAQAISKRPKGIKSGILWGKKERCPAPATAEETGTGP